MSPDFRAMVHNSKTGLYLFTKGLDREIGVATRPDTSTVPALDPTQSLHQSVRQRWDAVSTYRPKSLATYFKLVRDPRAVE